MTTALTLDLSRHCIETASKKALDASTRAYFKAGAKERAELSESIERLRLFLLQTDFPAARAAYPELCGAPGTRAVLSKAGVVISDGRVLALPVKEGPQGERGD